MKKHVSFLFLFFALFCAAQRPNPSHKRLVFSPSLPGSAVHEHLITCITSEGNTATFVAIREGSIFRIENLNVVTWEGIHIQSDQWLWPNMTYAVDLDSATVTDQGSDMFLRAIDNERWEIEGENGAKFSSQPLESYSFNAFEIEHRDNMVQWDQQYGFTIGLTNYALINPHLPVGARVLFAEFSYVGDGVSGIQMFAQFEYLFEAKSADDLFFTYQDVTPNGLTRLFHAMDYTVRSDQALLFGASGGAQTSLKGGRIYYLN
ncbi:MAG: hypothetical protein KDC35_14215 [Acidobacteria bacterium]|nr:hypothetical protein [Acidobacteriota bacterium]